MPSRLPDPAWFCFVTLDPRWTCAHLGGVFLSSEGEDVVALLTAPSWGLTVPGMQCVLDGRLQQDRPSPPAGLLLDGEGGVLRRSVLMPSMGPACDQFKMPTICFGDRGAHGGAVEGQDWKQGSGQRWATGAELLREEGRSGNSVQHLAGPGSLAGQSKWLSIGPDHRAQTRP